MIRATHWRAGIIPALFCFGGLLSACSARAPRLEAPRPDSTYSRQLAPGVVHRYGWYAGGPWAVHTVTIDPGVCGITLRTAKAQDRMIGREATSAMARRYAANDKVVAAINADFFSFDPPGVSEGPQISNGVLLKSEGAHREAIEDRRLRLQPVFALTRDGDAVVRHTRLRGEVKAGRRVVALAGINVRPRRDSAFVYTAFWGDTTPADSAALEFVLRSGVVTHVDSSYRGVEIPRAGQVVSVKGTARAVMAGVTVGDRMSWRAGLDGLSEAREVVGGYPMLLLNGKQVHHDEPGLRAAFSDRRHPRAALGVDRRGRIHIVAVDGRQPEHSDGMTLAEISGFLLAHGITDALNLDGGGSTTLVVHGQIVNRPSDSNGERAVANALLILDRSQAGSCARKR